MAIHCAIGVLIIFPALALKVNDLPVFNLLTIFIRE